MNKMTRKRLKMKIFWEKKWRFQRKMKKKMKLEEMEA